MGKLTFDLHGLWCFTLLILVNYYYYYKFRFDSSLKKTSGALTELPVLDIVDDSEAQVGALIPAGRRYHLERQQLIVFVCSGVKEWPAGARSVATGQR